MVAPPFGCAAGRGLRGTLRLVEGLGNNAPTHPPEELTVAHPFLSDEWIAEVRRIRESMPDLPTPPGVAGILVNLVVAGGPDGDKDFHLDGAAGGFEINTGHKDGAAAKVTIPFDTAKAMFVDGNPQAAMQAFMAGQIKIEGDMTRLMALQSVTSSPTPEQQAFQQRVQEITS